ncbi:MAG: transposase [Peptostreptococcaceae bacterium]
MKIGKDKVYRYYKLFSQGATVQEIYNQYQINKKNCGRKSIKLSDKKLRDINSKLDKDWYLDAIAGRDAINNVDVEIYFGDPGSPGQRGLNENSNGIIKKDLPKSTDLSVYSQEELNIIANKWNSVPRKSLKYRTPNEIIKKATGFNNLLPVA